jgi:hypothetical protein
MTGSAANFLSSRRAAAPWTADIRGFVTAWRGVRLEVSAGLDDPSMVASQAMSAWSWRKICLAMKRLRQRRISRGLFPSAVRRPM